MGENMSDNTNMSGKTRNQRREMNRKQVCLKFNNVDYERLARRADRMGVSIYAWIRQAIADREQWDDENA